MLTDLKVYTNYTVEVVAFNNTSSVADVVVTIRTDEGGECALLDTLLGGGREGLIDRRFVVSLRFGPNRISLPDIMRRAHLYFRIPFVWLTQSV